MISRSDRSSFASWWWTVDHIALVSMLALIAIGLMLAFAASTVSFHPPMIAAPAFDADPA